MEVAALAGLLALGYSLTRGGSGAPSAPEENTEAFTNTDTVTNQLPYGGLPTPIYLPDAKTPAGLPTVAGMPRRPRHVADGEMDLYYQLPSGGSVPSNPYTQPDLYARNIVFAAPTVAPQAPPSAVTAQVRMNTDGVEAPPVYNSGKMIISPLTGQPMEAADFTHNNMVPFFRGAPKQNMSDTANRHMLDDMVGSGSTVIGKREQAPLFDPHREPTGNVHGLESITDFVQDRMVAPTSRANEKPVEATMVGPGINQGYSAFPTGGFQQMDINEVMRGFKSVDETRVDSNPRLTYEGRMLAGKSLATQRGELGEVRKYRPDTFYLNEHGERNLVTVGENTKPMERPGQVMKFQSRTETSREEFGPAVAADFKATYEVPSFRAPHVRQQDGFGWRNADGSTYGTRNTDADNNDFGRAGYDLPVNQRNVTSERVHATNLTVAGGPKALTVYDPSDVARTTVRETTAANDWIGTAGAVGATKLTVYDPTDIARVTGRNTLAEPDQALNVTRAGIPGAQTLAYPDGMRLTAKAQVSAASAYTGSAGSIVGQEQNYDYAYAMRQNPTKEQVAAGRKPIAGAGLLSVFNGEDNMNVTFRKLDSDILNERQTAVDRVVSVPAGAAEIGIQRPPQPPLMTDVSRDRNIAEILDTLTENPYALPVHRIAAGNFHGPAALAMTGGYSSARI